MPGVRSAGREELNPGTIPVWSQASADDPFEKLNCGPSGAETGAWLHAEVRWNVQFLDR